MNVLIELLLCFIQVGLFSVGGGYAAIPLIQSQAVVRYQWLSMSEFTNLVTIAEMTPGPIAVNAATFVGLRVGGIPGMLIATFGCILPALFLVSLLSWLYHRFKGLSVVECVMACLRPAVVALIAAAGLSLLHTAVWNGGMLTVADTNGINAALFAGAFFVLRKWKKSPILVMCCCGAIGLLANLILTAGRLS